MLLTAVFLITLLSGLVAITGGNGLILMPSLLILGFDIKEILILIRTSAVVFVLFNLLALIQDKKVPALNKKDLFITILSSVTVILSSSLLTKLNDTILMLAITTILSGLFLLVIFKPKGKILNQIFIIVLPFFAGICGSAVGGAGLIITILYTLLGASPKESVQKRIIPSLTIQIIAFISLMNQGINVNYPTLCVIIIATAIAGYLNMKIFMMLKPRAVKILFYTSFIFSIFNLIEDAIENILFTHHMDWANLIKI